jgi:hypothetical protein
VNLDLLPAVYELTWELLIHFFCTIIIMNPIVLGLFILILVAVVGGLIYWSMNKKSEETEVTVESSNEGDTIIISNSGSKKESFVDSPYRFCFPNEREDDNRPTWCSNLNGTDPMSYWYDVENYDNTSPNANVIDKTTGECVNPNDCKKFTENLDSSNKLIDIKTADGTDFIETVGNDVYSGKLVIPDNVLSFIDFDFDTGVMAGKDPDGSSIVIKPGENYPIGLYITILFTLYKKAGKPKPNIKFDFKSGDANTLLTAMRRIG